MEKNKTVVCNHVKRLHFLRWGCFVLLIFLVLDSFADNKRKTEELRVVEGLEYSKITLKKGPVVIYQLRVDLLCRNLQLSGSLANGYLGFGLEKTSHMVVRENQKKKKVVAAVNADFFGGKVPVFENCMILDGEFVKGVRMSRTTLMKDVLGNIHLDNYQFDGICVLGNDSIDMAGLNVPVKNQECCFYNKYYRKMPLQADSVVYWRLKPLKNVTIDSMCNFQVLKRFVNPDSLDFTCDYNYLGLASSLDKKFKENDVIDIRLSVSPTGVSPYFLIGGLPKLIEKGKLIVDFKGREGLSRKGFWKDRHPRTAIGIDHKNNILYLVVVDGRQPDYSIGMKLKALGKYLKILGCDEALNFDGGGSSAMIVNQKLKNNPSDKKGERSVANMLLIKQR